MKTTRWALGVLVIGGLFVLDACTSSGQYRIPTVAPVVKQNKSEDDDLLKELEGDDSAPAAKPSSSKSSDSKSSGDAKASTDATADTHKTDATKADAAKADTAKTEAAKPAPTKTPAKK